MRELRGWTGCQNKRKRAEVQERGWAGGALGPFFGVGRGEQERCRDGGSLSGIPRL